MARRRIAVEETPMTLPVSDEEFSRVRESVHRTAMNNGTVRSEKPYPEEVYPAVFKNDATQKFQELVAKERHTAKSVRVVWGAETFSPTKFHVCIVGPFELEATVPEGEDPMPILHRLREELQAMAEAERERKLKSFIPNCAEH